MKKILVAIIIFVFFSYFLNRGIDVETPHRSTWWRFQSIDTMKFSRDVAREKLTDPSFNDVIKKQIDDIAGTGATHVAIATPYDEEFIPMLKRWVEIAREKKLKVWFRGNFAGWEEWFEYPKITQEEHIKKTRDFIHKHSELFEDGDVFTACPECENGGPGDPRQTRKVAEYRKFLIDEYKTTKEAFKSIDRNVASNFNSMNGDVARLIMDRPTTAALDGVVTIDHYVDTPEKLVSDVAQIAKNSGGNIVLGEFGAPIPDIHGEMTEKEQAEWVKEALIKLAEIHEVTGINYWTNVGGSTALWNEDGSAREVVSALTSVYRAKVFSGRIIDEAGGGIDTAYIKVGTRRFFTDDKGYFEFPYFTEREAIVEASDYVAKTINITNAEFSTVKLAQEKETITFKIRKLAHQLLTIIGLVSKI